MFYHARVFSKALLRSFDPFIALHCKFFLKPLSKIMADEIIENINDFGCVAKKELTLNVGPKVAPKTPATHYQQTKSKLKN